MKQGKWMVIATAAVLVFSLSYNVLQYNTIQLKTKTNDELMAQITSVQEEISAIQDNQKSNSDAIEAYMDGIEQKYSQLTAHYQSILKTQGKIIEKSGIDTRSYIHIYDIDAEDMSRHVFYYMEVPSDILMMSPEGESTQSIRVLNPEVDEDTLKVVIDDLLTNISMDLFNYLPIELDNLSFNGTGFSAEVNLLELSNSDQIEGYQGWANMYFQGSTGGSITESRLIYGLLQPELMGWPINEVKFTYQSQTIEFDHVPSLYETVNRADLINGFNQ